MAQKMTVGFIMVFLFTTAIATTVGLTIPPLPNEEGLRALLNPTPEVLHELYKINNALKAASASISTSGSAGQTYSLANGPMESLGLGLQHDTGLQGVHQSANIMDLNSLNQNHITQNVINDIFNRMTRPTQLHQQATQRSTSAMSDLEVAYTSFILSIAATSFRFLLSNTVMEQVGEMF